MHAVNNIRVDPESEGYLQSRNRDYLRLFDSIIIL
jgi:hypothetical protein